MRISRRVAARYSPLLVLALVQVVLVWAVPSNDGAAASDALRASGQVAGSADPGVVGASGGASSEAGAAAGGATGGGRQQGVAGRSGESATGGATTANRAPVVNAGCVGGRQAGPTFYMPPCTHTYVPNPTSTMPGVTATEIRFVYFIVQGNAQVNAILAEQGLAASPQEECQAAQAFTGELNKRYEFYGRHLVSLDGPGNNSGSAEGGSCHFPFFQSQCTVAPPDVACFNAESDEIAAMHPAFVIGGDAALFRVAQNHIMTVGGAAGADLLLQSAMDQVYPYYYNVFQSATQIVGELGSYYCTKLVGRPVQFAERGAGNVMPVSGPGPVRTLGILYASGGGFEIGTAAKQLADRVTKCGGANTKIYSYTGDIQTAETQEQTIMAELKTDHITTLICLCDPISPVFTTNAMVQQNYEPEFIIPGSGLLDYDPLAQLYNPHEMRHAFGLSELGNASPFSTSDTVKAWQDAGMTGQPNPSEILQWMYFAFMGSALQLAGPNLTVANLRAALSSFSGQGGDPLHPLWRYNDPWPDTAIKDVREVWYCPTHKSDIDGETGAWMPADGGRRYADAQFPAGTSELFPAGACV